MEFKRPQFKRPPLERGAWREWLYILAPAALLVAAAFWITSRFIQPAPPDTIIISAGAKGGAYHRYALEYQKILARDGIKLDVRESAGSLQNLARLRGATPEAGAAFVQGGTTQPEDADSMLSLGRLFYELVWVFHRLPPETSQLVQLAGKRIAVGPAGSGTHQLVMQLLRESGISPESATLLQMSAREALDKLNAGDIDAAFLVAAPEAEILQAPLRSNKIRLMSMAHADAYAKRHSHLSRITLHQGVIDLKENIPARDVQMIGAGALLAVRDDVHPALQFALTQTAAGVHKRPSIIYGENHFPQMQSSELPMSTVAEHFHKSGPPLLQRYLPFWLAVLMDRLLVLLIPLLAIVVPVVKFAPMLFDWRVNKRLWYWYDELRKLEAAIADAPDDRVKHIDELNRIDEGVSALPIPVSHSEQHYNLRSHVEYVRRRLEGAATDRAAATA